MGFKRVGNCSLCGILRQSLHKDHIIPKFKGGTEDESNFQYICANCHEDKTRRDRVDYQHSAETRAKLSAAAQRNADKPECRESLIQRLRAIPPPSAETRAKMSASAKHRKLREANGA